MPDGDGPQATAAKVFNDFVMELLEAEEKRRESIESRGTSVITVSGTLVTLLLGLAALVTKAQSFKLPGRSHGPLVVAVLVFVLAAFAAISTHVPQRYRALDPMALKNDLRARWAGSGDSALKKTTATRLEQLDMAQRSNDRKAWGLLSAVVAEVIAVMLLAWAVIAILSST